MVLSENSGLGSLLFSLSRLAGFVTFAGLIITDHILPKPIYEMPRMQIHTGYYELNNTSTAFCLPSGHVITGQH
jgi:hypothetical protein